MLSAGLFVFIKLLQALNYLWQQFWRARHQRRNSDGFDKKAVHMHGLFRKNEEGRADKLGCQMLKQD